MSLVFKRVNEMHYEEQHTFASGSGLYEALLGDQNFPTSSEGALPVVVEVPLGLVAAILYNAGAITFQCFIFDSSENITLSGRRETPTGLLANWRDGKLKLGKKRCRPQLGNSWIKTISEQP